MSTITISDLSPVGSELFSDSESYISELSDKEFDSINGGATMFLAPAAIAAARSSQACIQGAKRFGVGVAAAGAAVAGWITGSD
jgi:hypothetical protein